MSSNYIGYIHQFKHAHVGSPSETPAITPTPQAERKIRRYMVYLTAVPKL